MSDPRTVDDVLAWLASGHLKLDRELPPGPDTDRRAMELLGAFTQYPGALQTILEMSLFAPPVDFRLPEDEGRIYAQHRAGMNALVAAIVAYLAHAQNLRGKTDEPAPNELHDLALPGRWDDGRGGRAGFARDAASGHLGSGGRS